MTRTHETGGTEKLERRLMGSEPLVWHHRTCMPPSGAESNEIPSLLAINKWHSKKKRPAESISLVTYTSVDHLDALENQCMTWPDPVAAVVYLPMVYNQTGGPPVIPHFRYTSLEDVITGLEAFHYFMEGTAACALYLEFVAQMFNAPDFPGSFPTNALRNRALSLSPTNLAIPIDVDFVVTPMLGLPNEGYRDPKEYQKLISLTSEHKALVLPAFELKNRWQDITMARNIARSFVIAGKAMAREALNKGDLVAFRPEHNSGAHTVINFFRWADTNSSSQLSIRYKPGMEPCALVSLESVPFFDERFIDQIGGGPVWFAHLAASGYSFAVLADGFVVHVPHPMLDAPNKYLESQAEHRRLKMKAFQEKVTEEISGGTYAPVLRDCGIHEGRLFHGLTDFISSNKYR